MNKWFKNIFIFTLIIVFISAFSSSYSSLNIDNLTYVLAIGIDSSNDNKLEVSFHFSNPIPAESSASEKVSPIINTVTASSLSNAINLVNSYQGRQLNLSHCKVIIFSEEIAQKGISDEIYTLINDTQVRPSANIIVSKCNAKYYMKQIQPEIENLLSKYYEIFTDSSKYVGHMPDATIGGFFNALICNTCEPYAILGGINKDNSKTNSLDTSDFGDNSNNNSQKDYNIKANDSSVEGENKVENIGVAVFKEDKLVGELNALETMAFLSIRNKLDRFLVSVPDPLNNNQYLDIYLTPKSSSSVKVNTSTSSPYIKIKCEFTAQIYSMSENSKYLSNDVLDSISNSCNSYLESMLLDYLYKTAKDFKADINGFGNFAAKNFTTTNEYENYNWLDSYKDAFFDVQVNTSVKSGMLISES